MPDAAAERLLGAAMAGYAGDPVRGDFLLEYACSQAADPLPLYRVLYKFYNRQRRFGLAGDYAGRALAMAARRARLAPDPADWRREQLAALDPAVASHVLLALKAVAFIALRRGDDAIEQVAILNRLDPEDGSGASVVTALAESLLTGA